jgi:transposase
MKALSVLDPQAAAIDVGRERLHVSIGGEAPRVFGTFTGDLETLRDWLPQRGVRTVAMEATGVYWLYLYEVLEAAGLAVVVVNGRHVQNVPGRKTDLADCQWLATLHAHGLLRSGFVPPAEIRRLQDYQRLRADPLIGAASQGQKLQQALERMNLKFQDVISDLTGGSGQRVLRAILQGERRPGERLALCDEQIQNRKSAAVKESLRGGWKKEQLFALRQALEWWETDQEKIRACDAELQTLLQQLAAPPGPEGGSGLIGPVRLTPGKRPGKNTPAIERCQELLARLCGGRDATQIPGLGVELGLPILSETGPT